MYVWINVITMLGSHYHAWCYDLIVLFSGFGVNNTVHI